MEFGDRLTHCLADKMAQLSGSTAEDFSVKTQENVQMGRTTLAGMTIPAFLFKFIYLFGGGGGGERETERERE